MKQLYARILRNEETAEGFRRMRIESPYLGRTIKPGQFIEVRCSDRTETLLRRPFSVHRIFGDGIEILYEVVGKGTAILSEKKAGDHIDIIGPLGKGFVIDHRPKTTDRRSVVLVAGGIGVAPLVALAEHIVHSPRSIVNSKKNPMYVLLGARSKKHILCEREFRRLGAKIIVSTDDNSSGNKGLITESLEDLLSTIDYGPSTVYACGPVGMLKTVWQIAKARRAPCQVSLEERMACGVGVCLGCPVKVKTNDERRTTNDEYKMVCKDGPVFNAEEIAW